MSDREQAIDKIKKLLRMKRGGTPAEIETALALAAEIAARHGIDLDAVNPDDDQRKSEVGHEEPWVGRSVSYDVRYAAKLCELFFNVDVVYRQRVTRSYGQTIWLGYAAAFIGRKFEVEIATYIFKFLCGNFRRTWNTKRGRLRNRKRFVYGMFLGIRHKLEESRPEAPNTITAVAVSREAYIKEHFGALETVETKRPEIAETAATQGYLAGRATELRKAVSKPGPLQISL